jgi:hypothetical protein
MRVRLDQVFEEESQAGPGLRRARGSEERLDELRQVGPGRAVVGRRLQQLRHPAVPLGPLDQLVHHDAERLAVGGDHVEPLAQPELDHLRQLVLIVGVADRLMQPLFKRTRGGTHVAP